LKIDFNIIILSSPRSHKRTLSFNASHQVAAHVSLLSHAFHAPAHLILLDLAI
jgi:hypothetical protein